MARLTVNFFLNDLRRDAPAAFTEGSDLDIMLSELRVAGADGLDRVPGLRYTESLDRFSASMRFIQASGVDTNEGDPDDPATTIAISLNVLIDDDVAHGYRSEGNAVDTFISYVGSALGQAAAQLSNGGADLFQRIGLTDPATQITSEVILDITAPKGPNRPAED